MKLRNNRWPLIALTLLSIFAFFRSINEFPLRNWDEAWYGEISENMAINNTGLLMPFWNGRYYFDKPPMYFWLTYPILKIFGPGEWQARFVSVSAATLIPTLIYLIGKKLFNYKTGLVAAIIFLTLGQVVERFSHGNLDALLTLFSILSFYFYINRSPVVSGVFLAGAILTKGLVFGFFPLAWIMLFEFLLSKKEVKKIIKLISVLLIASLWWFALGSLKFGEEFVKSYITDLFAGNLSWKEPMLDTTLTKVFIRDIGFWFIPIIFHFVKNFKNKALLFLTLSVITLALPLNLLADKLGWFLLPLYPFASLIAGFSTSSLNKKYILILSLLIILQLNSIKNLDKENPDKSYISAELGKFIKMNYSPQTKIVLDSPDFSSFLYYSGLNEVTVASQSGGKINEWWIKSYDDISRFKGYLIITENPQKFDTVIQTITTAPYDYKLLELL